MTRKNLLDYYNNTKAKTGFITLKEPLDGWDVLQLLQLAANPFKRNSVDGVETPCRTSNSGEMLAAAAGQRLLINALAVYKQWKIDNNCGNEDT